MAFKEANVELDIEELDNQIENQIEDDLKDPTEKRIGVRTTVFSLGKDARVSSPPEITPPNLQFIEILKDGLDNPYVELNWRITRSDVDRAGVQGFGIFRRKVAREKLFKDQRRKLEPQRLFSHADFDRMSKKIPARGKFSNERKALYQIRRSLIPDVVRNPRLSISKSLARKKYESSLNRPSSPFSRTAGTISSVFGTQNPIINKGKFGTYFDNKRFQKIGYISYESFLKKEQAKFISVTEREFVDLTFADKQVGYGETYEYYVTSVSENIVESVQSNLVRLHIEDRTPVRPPTQLIAKQVAETEVQVSTCIDPRDNILRAIVYKKSETEVSFNHIASLTNVSNCIRFVDSNLEYGRSYAYRVFLEGMHGALSEPAEIKVVSSVQRVTPQSRSNNLRSPIITATQDQNSEFIKITISPNDPMVAYYELERRDLTINEKRFLPPSHDNTKYGGSGWESNKFFVERQRQPISKDSPDHKSLLSRRVIEKEIVFVDTTVEKDHIYQYRVHGCDLFCNSSPYGFSMVKTVGKKTLRSPINLKSEILRGTPIRIKVSWDDDNLANRFNLEELFQVESATAPDNVKVVYKIQRRKQGEIIYESFPMTANQFLVDEAPALDAVDFSGKKTRTPRQQPPSIVLGEGVTELPDSLSRPFNIPNFLNENEIYFYRIAAVDEFGEESNFTTELEVSTVPELSEPVDFRVEVLNTRVRPQVARLFWSTEKTKAVPDKWLIERKFDLESDTFEYIGSSFIRNEFIDVNVDSGNTYIYRIKSVDALGRESVFAEARLTL